MYIGQVIVYCKEFSHHASAFSFLGCKIYQLGKAALSDHIKSTLFIVRGYL